MRFPYEPVSLDVNKVCFEKENQIKNQDVATWCRCWKYAVMNTNVEYLSCGEVQALGYSRLSDMRHNDRNAVTERVSATLQQLYLIWAPAKTLENVIEF